MNEHSYIRAVTRHLPSENYKWKINDGYAGGVPDWFFEGISRDLWVEWKYIKPFPKRDTTLIDLTKDEYLSPLQKKWLIRRHTRRKDAWVIAGCEYGGVILRGLEWQQPLSAKDFKDRCLSHREICTKIVAETV